MVYNFRDGQEQLDDDEDKVETKNGRIKFATKLCPNTLKQAHTRSYDSGPLKNNQNLIFYINLLYRGENIPSYGRRDSNPKGWYT